MSFGQAIAHRRKELGLTQSELAAKVGVSQPIVARWEKDQTRPRPNKLGSLAKSLEMPEAELLLEAGQPDPSLQERPIITELMQHLPQLSNGQLEALCVVIRDMAARSQMDRLLKA